MSKDMLGSVVRAAVGVPQSRYDLLAKIASDLSADNPQGEEWYKLYAQTRRVGIAPKGKEGEVLCTRPISVGYELILPANDGTKTIAQARDVFRCIDPCFENWKLDVTSAPTPAQPVIVHEIIKVDDFKTIFGEIGDIPRLCLTQGQILDFARLYKEWLWSERFGTFFLFRKEDEFFVAFVYPYSGSGLGVFGYRFLEDRGIWDPGYCRRLVVPQLTL